MLNLAVQAGRFLIVIYLKAVKLDILFMYVIITAAINK